MKERVNMTTVLDASSVRMTRDGYLTARVRVARAGIQDYRGYEVGRPDLEHVRVYRPPEQVFSKDSLKSYAHRPVTNDHPPVAVDSANWKKYSVGSTGDEVVRDGDYVVVPLVLMDEMVIRDYREGKKQLSLGYQTELTWDSGETPSGEQYDAVQTDIRANHLAVVVAARGGPHLKIGDDTQTGEQDMTVPNLKSVTLDGLTVDMTDIAAQHVNRVLSAKDSRISELEKQTTDTKTAADKIEVDAKTKAAADAATITAKDARIAELEKSVADSAMTPAKLDALVGERSNAVIAAKKVLGDRLVVDGKTIVDIRRQVVDAKMGAAAKDFGDAEVTAAFNALVATSPAADTRQHNGYSGQRDVLATALSDAPHNAMDAREKAYADQDTYLKNAWRGKQPAA